MKHLPQQCTVREIAEFYGKSQKHIYQTLKKNSIPVLKNTRMNGVGPPSRLFDSFDVVGLFAKKTKKDIKKSRNYDCDLYGECLTKAAFGPHANAWPGMECGECGGKGL